MPILIGVIVAMLCGYQMFFRYQRWTSDERPGVMFEYDKLTHETHEIEPGGKKDSLAHLFGPGDSRSGSDGADRPLVGELDSQTSRYVDPIDPRAEASYDDARGLTANANVESQSLGNRSGGRDQSASMDDGFVDFRGPSDDGSSDGGNLVPLNRPTSRRSTRYNDDLSNRSQAIGLENAPEPMTPIRLRGRYAPDKSDAMTSTGFRLRGRVQESRSPVIESLGDSPSAIIPLRLPNRRHSVDASIPGAGTDEDSDSSNDWMGLRPRRSVHHVPLPVVTPDEPVIHPYRHSIRDVPVPQNLVVASKAPPIPASTMLASVDDPDNGKDPAHPFAVHKVDLNQDGAREDIIQKATTGDGLIDISIVKEGREIFYGRGRQIGLLPTHNKQGWADILIRTSSNRRKVFRYDVVSGTYKLLDNPKG